MIKHPSASVRNVAIALAIALFAVLVFAPKYLAIFVATQGNDAQSVADLATTTVEADAFDGYSVVAIIYAHLNGAERILTLLGLGIALIVTLFWYLRLPRTLILAGFCLLPAFLLYLPLFTKDTFVTPLVISATLILVSIRTSKLFKIASVVAAYCSFGFAFRSYYFLIAGAWLGIILFISLSWRWRFASLLVLPLLMLAIPTELYDTLQMQRDAVNYTRVGMAGAGFRTAFMNLFEPHGLGTFAGNYAYAAYRLNLPIFSAGVGPKELYLFVVLCVYGWLAVIGLRSGNARISWVSGLFLAHILVLNIFEPDLGSYLRHLSTVVLLLAPSLIMRDQLWQSSMRDQLAVARQRRGPSISSRGAA